MYTRKIILLTAALLAVVFVGSLLAAPMWELQDKTWFWLTKDKANNATGYVSASYTKVSHDGEDCLQTVKKTFAGKALLEYTWVRGKKQPLYSLTLKRNGKVIAKGHNVPDGYEFKIKGKDVKISKEDFDFFTFDEQNIYDNVGAGETKELNLFDPAKGKVVAKTYVGKGEKKMKLHGKDVVALAFEVVDGAVKWEVKVAKKTLALLVANNATDGSKIKRVKKKDAKAAFPAKL